MSDHIELLAELRSAAKTMGIKGAGNTLTHMLAAQLIARAADALATSYTPAQMAESFRAGLATARMHDHDVNPSAPDWRNAPPEAQFCAMDSDEADGPLNTEQLLIMAARAQRSAVGESSVIATRIDQMVSDVRTAKEAK